MKLNSIFANKYVRDVILLLVGALIAFLVDKWRTPSPELEIYTAFIDSQPYRADASGSLHMNVQPDEKNCFNIDISSIGNKESEDIFVDITCRRKGLFKEPTIIFDPPMVEQFVLSANEISTSERIYFGLSVLPEGAKIKILIDGNSHFLESEIYISVIANGKVQKIIRKEIEYKNALNINFKNIFSSNKLYAQTVTDSASIDTQKTKSGIFIGGYDPVAITNGVFLLLQNEKLITKSEALNIKKLTEESQLGIKFGGVDVLKFDEAVLNILLKKGIINITQAKLLVERSRNAGGVLINGYNVIQLNYEILNHLVENGYIKLKDAQEILDNAKSK
ncbi:hypothetical protein MUP95_02800 [bacterium]|nr:hypothetical protein [bacterium]